MKLYMTYFILLHITSYFTVIVFQNYPGHGQFKTDQAMNDLSPCDSYVVIGILVTFHEH
jgi:hypothetical protein